MGLQQLKLQGHTCPGLLIPPPLLIFCCAEALEHVPAASSMLKGYCMQMCAAGVV
jgi:hypothetical protein